MTMATLALGPTLPVRPRSGSKRDHHKHRVRGAQRTPWRTIAITAGAISIAFFSVSAPLIGDPSGRLFALDATPVVPSGASFVGDAWPVRAFEFAPTLLGPAITDDLLSLADSDWPVLVMMPVFEIRALPPVDDDETSPRG
jgi:hypothetical protein